MIRVNATIDSSYFVDVATGAKVIRAVEKALDDRLEKEGNKYSLTVSFARNPNHTVIVEHNVNWSGINYQPTQEAALFINHDLQKITNEAANEALFG